MNASWRALGVTLVVLGAVLTAPSASAAPATISVSPVCGRSSVVLTVTAAGVPPGDLYLRAERPNGDAQSMGSAADGAGRLTEKFDVDLGNAPGAWVSVHSYGTNTQHASTWYEVGCASFTASPRLLAEQPGPQQFAVGLSGFQPAAPVELSLPGIPAKSVTPNADGVFTGTVTFVRQPACGRSVLTARQRTFDPDPPTPPIPLTFVPSAAPSISVAPPAGVERVRTVTLTVFCPRLTVTPGALADSALPGTVNVAGTGWMPARPVQLSPGGTTVVTDRTGAFTTKAPLPRLACGPHKLEAVQASAKPQLTLRRSATFTVTCTPAFLAVDPAVTPAGMVTTAAGAGFTPGRTVRLEWLDLDGRPIGDAGTTQVGTGGTFLHACLVLPNSLLGTRRLRAVEVPAPGDPVAARNGIADLLVVPSAMERGRDQFLERG